jgi:hypothetical protein
LQRGGLAESADGIHEAFPLVFYQVFRQQLSGT